MAEVKLKGISKVYESGVTAVNELNLVVADKEFVVLLGPSGCGKTTTLRIIARLEEVSSGEIYIGDRLVNDVSPRDRDIAMGFQNYALYPHMTVYENMAFGLKLRKFPKAEIDARVKGQHTFSESLSTSIGGPKFCQAGSGSGLLWEGQSSVNLKCSYSMSRCQTSMRSCALRCVPKFPSFIAIGRDNDIRDTRSSRGNDHGGQDRFDERRGSPAGRESTGTV